MVATDLNGRAGCHDFEVDTTAFLHHLQTDGPALAAVAKADPAAAVPTCPKWTLADLLAHVGGAHHWAEETVRTRATEFTPFVKPPKDFDAVCAWYDEGLDQLVRTLSAVDPDEPVWNFQALGVAPAGFWQRRMAHETAVHRWDAENANGSAAPIDAPMAADGIDEYLGLVSAFLSMRPNDALGGALGLEALDVPLALTVTLGPNQVSSGPGLDGADAVVRAMASDLLLWLVGRRQMQKEAFAIEGDASVADAWATVRF
jgi:uncharacterized protein (TIGR03083 family)